MSLKSETFLALQCDYPSCGELFDNDEFTYYADGPDPSDAEEAGWLVLGDSCWTAFCAEHVREVPCPPETHSVDAFGDGYCVWCDDHATDTHLAPYTTSIEDQLELAMKRVIHRAHTDLDLLMFRVDRKLGTDRLGGAGSVRGRTDLALSDIHRRACLAIRPDLTLSDLHRLTMAPAA